MARGVQNFFEGFNKGYETVGRIARDYQSREVASATPEETTAYTPDQVQSMESIANTVDEQGNRVYEFVPQEGTANYGLRVRQPDGSYQPVEGAGMAPQSRKRFLGKDYDPAELTPEKVDRLRYGALADVEARFDPAKGLRMRREVGQMEREDKLQARQDQQWAREDKAFATAEAQKEGLQQFMNSRLTQPDGTKRPPTAEDFAAATQFQTAQLYDAGDYEGVSKALERNMAYMNNQIQFQKAERESAIGPATAAAAQGDFGPLVNFYNKFVPDGGKVTDIRMGEKGEITVMRQSVDGKPMPSQTIKGGVRELIAGAEQLVNPGALAKFSMDSFTQMLALRKDARDEQRLGIDRRVADAQVARATNERRDPIMLMDAQGKPVILDRSRLPYDDKGVARLPAGLRMPPKEMTPAQEATALKALVDAGMSIPQARIALDDMRGVTRPGDAGAGDEGLARLNQERGQPAPAPAPAAQSPAQPPRRAGIIVPPRTAADLRPRPPVSDDQFLTDTLGPIMQR